MWSGLTVSPRPSLPPTRCRRDGRRGVGGLDLVGVALGPVRVDIHRWLIWLTWENRWKRYVLYKSLRGSRLRSRRPLDGWLFPVRVPDPYWLVIGHGRGLTPTGKSKKILSFQEYKWYQPLLALRET